MDVREAVGEGETVPVEAPVEAGVGEGWDDPTPDPLGELEGESVAVLVEVTEATR